MYRLQTAYFSFVFEMLAEGLTTLWGRIEVK